MIVTQVANRALDRAPAALPIGQFLRAGLGAIEFPIGALALPQIAPVEIAWIEFSLIRQAAENAPRLIENGALDALRDISREFMVVRIPPPVAERLQKSPIAG